MLLTKYTHACVRVDDGDRRLLLDPGIWTEPEAFDGVTDILVTHEHADHFAVEPIAALLASSPELRIYGHESLRAVAIEENAPAVAEAIQAVAVGETFTAAGFAVTAVGGKHAETYDGLPRCANIGFIVDGVYHPGDSFFVPAEPVATLLVPASGPWFKLREALDFTRAIAPQRAVPIHDRMLSADVGYDNFDGWLTEKGGTAYERIPLGTSLTV
ncbi:L-ascorbate metabolism protein UlaG (beta-lactamase superfamily) [Asanoa ferruginea]|uniref:L-ascorbate metabolism protein UlaG (Beta-lactamase superfamily) n=1 Tax=Asanoa ferruginea TaxID=53367 RepID=A0A3D9ZLF3_9ACTN|nr:MBL fold metallo-hydrolase [Asanoa ferruginea]REF97424.1 L-ascorbate metabolism protein UlaG (beta-lactamase superfamily) [Asanoa ferruginea]GIF48292.1 MBL fold metallo-hydrolase [Asanoa ferruginea]